MRARPRRKADEVHGAMVTGKTMSKTMSKKVARMGRHKFDLELEPTMVICFNLCYMFNNSFTIVYIIWIYVYIYSHGVYLCVISVLLISCYYDV